MASAGSISTNGSNAVSIEMQPSMSKTSLRDTSTQHTLGGVHSKWYIKPKRVSSFEIGANTDIDVGVSSSDESLMNNISQLALSPATVSSFQQPPPNKKQNRGHRKQPSVIKEVDTKKSDLLSPTDDKTD